MCSSQEKHILIFEKRSTTLRRLRHVLKRLDFALSIYDQDVTKKIINGYHCSITWYIDNLKIKYHI